MSAIERRKTLPVRVRDLIIGGDAPISVQSMTNTKTSDIEATLSQIEALNAAGCDVVRVAVPDRKAAEALGLLVKKSPLPIIADIHFDASLAHMAIEKGAAKVRINPGNLGGQEKLIAIADRARRHGTAIRVGVNAGSLERSISKKFGESTADAMAESALNYLHILEQAGFENTVVSLKASDVYTTIRANRIFAAKSIAPIHLGITEAGPPERGIIKGAVGIGALLADGIGDTVRVSLTASPVEEIIVARRIIQSLGLGNFEPELISCPTCGRCETDLVELTDQVRQVLSGYSCSLKIAVMGCAVNGPGESRDADLGLTAGKKKGLIFKDGLVIRTVEQDLLLHALKEEIERLIGEREKMSGQEEVR